MQIERLEFMQAPLPTSGIVLKSRVVTYGTPYFGNISLPPPSIDDLPISIQPGWVNSSTVRGAGSRSVEIMMVAFTFYLL